MHRYHYHCACWRLLIFGLLIHAWSPISSRFRQFNSICDMHHTPTAIGNQFLLPEAIHPYLQLSARLSNLELKRTCREILIEC
jgi:hypothetical protein